MSLARERLSVLLAEPALTSVALVIAPPGYGKTTVLRDYAAGDPDAVYVALPEAADLEAVVRAILAAAAPAGLRSIGALFANPAERNFEERAAEWLVSRLRRVHGALIVDDLHRAAGDERVVRVLAAAIAATHGRMRWIVSSREAPRFPMGSWIARGWMGLPLTSDDLRFTPDESAALAADLGLTVSSADLATIVDDTLGWPIGVRLALGLVARKRSAGLTRMQTRDALYALLEDEVWQPLDADVRRLIAAAVLVPAPAISTLLAAGFPDARTAMATVFERVPFVQPIDDDAFSIHDLFREFVISRTPRETESNEGAARMGAALLGEGNAADGLRLLVAAGRADDVVLALAEHAFDLLETGNRAVVNAGLALLAERGRNDEGVALAIRGALAFSDGSGSNSANLFARAIKRDLPPGMRSEVSRRLALSYANRGMMDEAITVLQSLGTGAETFVDDRLENQALELGFSVAAGKYGPGEAARRIAEIELRLADLSPATQVRVLQRLGNAALYSGDLESAERLSQDAALLASELGMDTFAALAYGTLYSVAGLSDPDMSRARSYLRSQADAAERAANTALRVYALRGQYIIAAMNAEFAEAQALESMLSSLVDARSYRNAFIFRFAHALQNVAQSNVAKAEATMRSMPPSLLSPAQQLRREAFLVVLQLLNHERAAAAAGLERALLTEASLDQLSRLEIAYAYTFRGIAYWALDRPAQARKSFEFDMAGLPQRDRVLIDAFRRLSALPHPLPNADAIPEICSTLGGAGFGAYVELLRRLVELDANDVALSAAEIETLRAFDRCGGRAVDVAKALGKSRYTVQNQIQSAIRKLGCHGRAEALAYARQRGWLDKTPS
jgi:ATP/maltotriose-dependent transcriptional regulator MalT/DNA-binding CsgD family transcriptional regulator